LATSVVTKSDKKQDSYVVKRSTPPTLYKIRLSSNIQRFKIDEINDDRIDIKHQQSIICHNRCTVRRPSPTTERTMYDIKGGDVVTPNTDGRWQWASSVIDLWWVVVCRVFLWFVAGIFNGGDGVFDVCKKWQER
jgi:hypothetical protein